MAEPYVGEIRIFAGNFAPADWAFCDGSLMDIGTYDTLFTLIGTTYGGDGQSTFALPDLRGRLPVHQGTGLSTYSIGQMAGQETVTLQTTQLPVHTHSVAANGSAGTTSSPTGNVPGTWSEGLQYTSASASTPMSASAIGAAGGGQPHENMQPFTCINFIISLYGIFPSQ
jgi:microcystin-dependent protein